MKDAGRDPTESPSNGGTGAALSFWWLLLVFLAACVPFGLLARVLHLSFDLPEDSIIVYPSGFIVVCAVVYAAPRTFQQLGRVAVIGVGVGILAMLCYLPVELFAQDFTISHRRLMLRLLGTVLIVWVGGWAALVACKRWGVPLQRDLKNTASNPSPLGTAGSRKRVRNPRVNSAK